MGFTGTILAAKTRDLIGGKRTLATFGFHEPESVSEGWVIDEAHRHAGDAAEYFESLVAAIDGPVLVVEVFDSDVAHLIAGAPASETVHLHLTPAAARAAGMSVPSSRERVASLEAFSRWSSAAPAPITVEGLQALIDVGNVFAEGVVWELLDALRIRLRASTGEVPIL